MRLRICSQNLEKARAHEIELKSEIDALNIEFDKINSSAELHNMIISKGHEEGKRLVMLGPSKQLLRPILQEEGKSNPSCFRFTTFHYRRDTNKLGGLENQRND